MYDVIIIGAGPAGTATGYDLSMAGLSVLILDRRTFPRKKACAGGITPKAMNVFAYDISGQIERVCREVRVCRPGGRSFTVREKVPLCYMTRRERLDSFSLNKAVSVGSRFLAVSRLCRISQTDRSVAVHTSDSCFTGRYLIGADGANSKVRQLAARPGNPYRVRKYPALEADVAVDPEHFPMEFDFSQGLPGYYWIFPKKDYVNIGIFAAPGSRAVTTGHLAAYAQKRLGNDRLCNIKGYPIGSGGSYGFPAQRPGTGRILLAGDAAGFAEPLLGEGIYFALKSGRLAAASIIRAIQDGGNALDAYHLSLARTRTDLRLYGLAASILYRFPGPSLGLARHRLMHSRFSKGYAAGLPLSRILFPF
ncbi:MAG: geranylgeranyl reductase family protein [Desulfobacter sp.]